MEGVGEGEVGPRPPSNPRPRFSSQDHQAPVTEDVVVAGRVSLEASSSDNKMDMHGKVVCVCV